RPLLGNEVRVRIDAALARTVERVAARPDTRGVAVAERCVLIRRGGPRGHGGERCQQEHQNDETDAAGQRDDAHNAPPGWARASNVPPRRIAAKSSVCTGSPQAPAGATFKRWQFLIPPGRAGVRSGGFVAAWFSSSAPTCCCRTG